MKSKLKIREIIELDHAFKALDKIPIDAYDAYPSVRLSYATTKTESKISHVIKSWDKARALSPQFLEYEKERAALNLELCQKTTDNIPVFTEDRSNFVIDPKNVKRYEKDFAALQKKHKRALDARKVQEKGLTELMEKEEEVELHAFSLSDFPPKVHKLVMKALMPMVEE